MTTKRVIDVLYFLAELLFDGIEYKNRKKKK